MPSQVESSHGSISNGVDSLDADVPPAVPRDASALARSSSSHRYASAVATLKSGVINNRSDRGSGGKGIIRSPWPHAKAITAPLHRNGTSAPSDAPIFISTDSPNGCGDRESRIRRTPAASALPPPSPAPTGILLVSEMRNPFGQAATLAYAAAARYARFDSGGPVTAPSTSIDRSPSVISTSISSDRSMRWKTVSIE